MIREQLIQALYKIQVFQFGEFTLKNGQRSSVYLDLRPVISSPDILRAVATALWQTSSGRGKAAERICGVPYSALPIATCIPLQHNIPMIMRRKVQKNHGTRKIIEGTFQRGQSCLVIEDVITTGSSILGTIQDLEVAGLGIADIAVLVDRDEGGRKALEDRGYHVHAAFTLPEVFQTLLEYPDVDEETRERILDLIRERA